MKLILAVCVALLGTSALLSSVKAQDEPEPVFHEIGARVPGDGLVDMYYEHSEPTETPTTHTVTINWEYRDINFIRIFIYDADHATSLATGLPGSAGSITVTADNVTNMQVYAYLYGFE